MRPDSQHRVGRRRSTTWDHISNVAIDLFAARGFDEVSVDDVAEAAGIARRTLFRYYPSKNALPWGDFDAHLDHMRDLLDDLEPDVPIGEALRTALLAFNSFDEQETARHRQRMRVILETAALQAYSMTMYAGWRAVVAAFVAQRLGAKAGRPRAADRGVDDARRRAVGLRALAGRRVGVAGAGAGRCVRHGQRRAGGAGLKRAAEKILDWGVGVRRRGGDDKGVSAEPDGNDAPRALLALYDDALPVVYGYFVRRCGDRGTAEDLTSETFLAAMDAARKDAPPPITVPWLLGVARHKLADHYRRRHDRFSVPVAELPEPVDPADDWDAELDRIVAESVLARLPEQHRTVLALRYMDDCSVPECAELIGRTVHATEALLVRARRAFRSHYPEPEGGKS